MDLKHRLLRESFGYSSFRPGQERLIDAMLAGQDVLGVMPTGAGKSICYQLSAMLLPGVTLVVSPLISLMHDQVDALRAAGISACLLNSAQTAQERRQSIQQASMGRCKLIYVAPERLSTPEFAQLIARLPISMVAVDEAHCISQWGHDFRPSYRQIPASIASLPHRPVVSAFTATATVQVRDDIVQALGLRHPDCLVTSFDRPNLYYEVQRPYDRELQLLQFIETQQAASGIVYCLTRKKTEELTQYLCGHGIDAVCYHAGMDSALRKRSQQRFVCDDVPVIVATNAFGMGIDKSNVQFVVHFGMPRDLESYYQEAGRAGRDGSPAHCLLLYHESDIQLHEFLIERDPDNPALTDKEVARLKKRNYSRLKQMKRYVYSEGCLRQHILRYFGESAPDFCGNCGSCEASSIARDVTVEAQKILSCVYRAKQRCDSATILRILRGCADDAIRQAGYDALSTFGIMRETAEEDIQTVVDRLLSLGYLVRREDGCLCLRERAKQVLFRGERVALRVRVSPGEARRRRESMQSERPELFELLQKHRKKVAQLSGIPPYAVFDNRTLEDMVHRLPRSPDALREVAGVGQTKAARFGKGFLTVIQRYCEQYLSEKE